MGRLSIEARPPLPSTPMTTVSGPIAAVGRVTGLVSNKVNSRKMAKRGVGVKTYSVPPS